MSAEDGPPGIKKEEEKEDAPPGIEKEADQLAGELATSAQVANAPDEPDLALRLTEGLRERPEAAITTQTDEGNMYSSAHTFEELNLSPDLLKGLYVEMKFERPSRIQSSTLPMILTPPYKDLIAQAHNGSGKTTCFVLSMLSRVDPKVNEPQALCTCPTRELVVQNLSVLNRMGKFTGIRATSTASDFEGSQFRKERITEQVVVGTHGKLKAWANKRILSLDGIRILVFDEADEMLKADAFADDSVRLIKSIRKKNPGVQLLLFSATFNEPVKKFAMQIAPKANHMFVAKEELSLDVIAQHNVRCPDATAKTRVLKEMIFPNCERLGQTIIFVRTREAARTLHAAMEAEGYKCTSIQGDMDHNDRDRVVQEFRDGATKILISTDVLSRGFDVSQVTLVINYDVPVERDQRTPNYETYLHRIGRSGRFGRKGAAFNLIATGEDERIMNAISTYFNKTITEIEWDDEDKFMDVLKKSL
uniref:RNA helicase n=1 Tax=Chlamydomonas leiostraca TaxID=1034604 RepID=A0A7S0WXR9_9CHLO|mmetsp:Transcript_33780/g.85539  ORF Transcript_33780/g.85539 Transcript_33780/m.85539 type:complete len:477 (+) Transcript_33780:169-1599(+)|eukprot:CAMPEP_0202867706 /NCGR_PEP_ID=MMETSP1391-20130828/9578_1 /ASSEMBLY_ACC=CAM_ASM_000867 /TAXON_ID=1034604 /ORGANISM="Chlamydomonas leiostraca, Strain SAG 11-49" /LENGTH=476 /DNA_ID=CAMNT_0049547769 /DNA_START=168 /DNA_END=1598 /DNA_ORIENTATION=+